MLKYILLAGAMTCSVGAVALTGQQPQQSAPQPATTGPVSSATPPAVETTPSAPSSTSPGIATPAVPGATTVQTTPSAQPAGDATTKVGVAPDPVPPRTAAVAATPPAQVVQIVDAEFPAYDINKDGVLDRMEFSAWMNRLKAAEPDAGKKWNDAAFAQADADRSSTLSKDELTGFLSGGVAS